MNNNKTKTQIEIPKNQDQPQQQSQNNITRKQNTKDKPHSKIDNNPPSNNDQEFSKLETQPGTSNSYNITIIPETPIEELQQQSGKTFQSPSLIPTTNFTNSAPQPVDFSIPNKTNDTDERIEIHQIKIEAQQHQQSQAIKLIDQLQKMNFRDTGCLINAYNFERNNIIALMYYKLGRFDPYDKFIETY